MRDHRRNLQNVWRAAARLSTDDGARHILFAAAREADDAAAVAASFALLTAKRARQAAILIDADLRRNAALLAFDKGFGGALGRPGKGAPLRLAPEPFFRVMPGDLRLREASGALLAAHRIGNSRLLVTSFDSGSVKPGQRLQIRSARAWWQALRGEADWITVTAPPLERSGAALALAGEADAVVLVLRADDTRADEALELKRETEAHGGRVLGAVMLGRGMDAALADRIA